MPTTGLYCYFWVVVDPPQWIIGIISLQRGDLTEIESRVSGNRFKLCTVCTHTHTHTDGSVLLAYISAMVTDDLLY